MYRGELEAGTCAPRRETGSAKSTIRNERRDGTTSGLRRFMRREVESPLLQARKHLAEMNGFGGEVAAINWADPTRVEGAIIK